MLNVHLLGTLLIPDTKEDGTFNEARTIRALRIKKMRNIAQLLAVFQLPLTNCVQL